MSQTNIQTDTQTNFKISDLSYINNGITGKNKTKSIQRKKSMKTGALVQKIWLKIHKKMHVNMNRRMI